MPILIKNLIPEHEAISYAQQMLELHAEGKTKPDEQCPASDSLYNHKLFDDLLLKLRDTLSDTISVSLLPTYAYARIYRPGQILKIHRDRPACEHSVTICLDYDAEYKWPLYFSNFPDKSDAESVTMNRGDGVIYRGMDLYHWREAFEGKWHAQVFCHYVDKNGPARFHANELYKKRRALEKVHATDVAIY